MLRRFYLREMSRRDTTPERETINCFAPRGKLKTPYGVFIVPREGVEPPTPASSEAEFGLSHHPHNKDVGRCLRDYCWDSPTSLYAFSVTFCPTELGSGLFSLLHLRKFSPSSPDFHQLVTELRPKEFRAALYR